MRNALVIGGGVAGPVTALALRKAGIDATPVLMRLMLKTAMRPEKTFGPDQRYRIDWSAPVVQST